MNMGACIKGGSSNKVLWLDAGNEVPCGKREKEIDDKRGKQGVHKVEAEITKPDKSIDEPNHPIAVSVPKENMLLQDGIFAIFVRMIGTAIRMLDARCDISAGNIRSFNPVVLIRSVWSFKCDRIDKGK